MGILTPLIGAAASALLQRTYLFQTETPDGIPRILAVLDAVTEENPEYTADVTQHPVEVGPEVSDHIQLKNPRLRLVGTISNTPLDLSSSIGNLIAGGTAFFSSAQARENILNTGISQAASIIGAKILGNASNPLSGGLAGAADAIARTILLNAFEQRQPFDVMTKRQKYGNMVIEKLHFPRDTRTGHQLAFEMDMIHLRIVSPFAVQINTVSEDVVTSAVDKTDLGAQSSAGVSDQASSSANKSWLRQIIKGTGKS